MRHRNNRSGVRRLSLAASLAAGAVMAASVALPTAPAHAVGAGTYAYVVDDVTGSVYVVDTATGSTVATVPVGPGTSSIVVSADGRKAYTTGYGDDTVSVIDTGQEAVVATIRLPGASGTGATAENLSPDGSTLYVVDPDNDQLHAIDTATDTLTTTVSIPHFSGAVVATSTQVYLTDAGTSAVGVYDAHTLALVTTIEVPGTPQDLTRIPGTDLIYVATDGDGATAGGAAVIDTATDTATATGAPYFGNGTYAAASPDGTRAYIADRFALHVYDTSSGTPLSEVAHGTNVTDLAVGPDGRIYLTRLPGDGTGELQVLDSSTLTAVKTTTFPDHVRAVAIGTSAPAPAGKADLQGRIGGPSSGKANTAYTYTVTAKNIGPGAASGVSAGLLLPPRTMLVSATGTYVQRGQLVLWKAVPGLGVNASATFQVTVRFTTRGAKVLLGGVWSHTPDPKPWNNVPLGGALIR